MARRLKLSAILNGIATNVYFQPGPNTQMQYPCITYDEARDDVQFASNLPYRRAERYTLTVISKEADEPLKDAVRDLPSCTMSTHFVVDQLHHNVFDIFI